MKAVLTFSTLLSLPLYSYAFECYSCNSGDAEDDSKPCVETIEKCEEGVESCSAVRYRSLGDDKVHIRKFCTSAGTPIYQYLLFFPGSSLCQSVSTESDRKKFPVGPEPPPFELPEEARLTRAKRIRRAAEASPPAPPHAHTSNVLCVCSQERCNGGSFDDVVHRSIASSVHATDLDKSKKPESLQEIA